MPSLDVLMLDKLQDIVAVAAAAFGLVAAVAVAQLGKGGSLTKGLGWAIFGFAAIAIAATISAYSDFIVHVTPEDVRILVEDALRALGLVCFAVFFYRFGRAYLSMTSDG